MSLERKGEISTRLNEVNQRISAATLAAGRDLSDIKLIAVTKTFSVTDLNYLYELGVRDFGENRDQEAREKVALLPREINWHFQGQIQSNKLKSITGWAKCIHSIDQFKYAKMVSDFANNQIRSIFLQVSLDKIPESRGGVDPVKLHELANQVSKLPNLKLMGLMAVAPLNEETDQALSRLAEIHTKFIRGFPEAKFLSAGYRDWET